MAETATQTHYVSKSGRRWTKSQKALYYATKGFKNRPRKSKRKR